MNSHGTALLSTLLLLLSYNEAQRRRESRHSVSFRYNSNCCNVLVAGLLQPVEGGASLDADDNDTIDWSALKASMGGAGGGGVEMDENQWEMMRKHMSEEEIKHLLSEITSPTTRNVRRVRRELQDDREKRLPRLGVRSPLPRFGVRSEDEEEEEEDDRDKRLPRVGKRLPRFGLRSYDEDAEGLEELDEGEERDKRLPRMGRRAAPFPRLGRAAPFPRLGRASPFPRLGRAAPFPRLGRASPFPRLGHNVVEATEVKVERASPFPRLG